MLLVDHILNLKKRKRRERIVLFIIIPLFILIVLLAYFIKPRIKHYNYQRTNYEIINFYYNVLITDSVFYRNITKLMLEVKTMPNEEVTYYKGTRSLVNITSGSDISKLYTSLLNLCSEHLKSGSNVRYCDSVVYFLFDFRKYDVLNQKDGISFLMFTQKELSNLQLNFKDYKLYENEIPLDSSKWIYRLDDNWYIYSP